MCLGHSDGSYWSMDQVEVGSNIYICIYIYIILISESGWLLCL